MGFEERQRREGSQRRKRNGPRKGWRERKKMKRKWLKKKRERNEKALTMGWKKSEDTLTDLEWEALSTKEQRRGGGTWPRSEEGEERLDRGAKKGREWFDRGAKKGRRDHGQIAEKVEERLWRTSRKWEKEAVIEKRKISRKGDSCSFKKMRSDEFYSYASQTILFDCLIKRRDSNDEYRGLKIFKQRERFSFWTLKPGSETARKLNQSSVISFALWIWYYHTLFSVSRCHHLNYMNTTHLFEHRRFSSTRAEIWLIAADF